MAGFSLTRYLPLETVTTTALIFSLLLLPPTHLVAQAVPTVAVASLASLALLVLDGLALTTMQSAGGTDRRQGFTSLLQSIALHVPAIVVAYVFIVLFGAPITTHQVETLALATYLVVMACTPSILVYKTSIEDYQMVFARHERRDQVDRALAYPALGALIGCWLGAFPIPLDWDRPWQRWPITCVLGILLGRTVGVMVSIVLCIDHDDDDNVPPAATLRVKKQE